jgi:hypothetical protein
VIEGWYGDGNFACTSTMYALMKTGGTHISPWCSNVLFGAVPTKKGLEMVIQSTENWSGKLLFDRVRHQENLHLPMDWPRINQFPEWFPVHDNTGYKVTDLTTRRSRVIHRKNLIEGYTLALKKRDHSLIYRIHIEGKHSVRMVLGKERLSISFLLKLHTLVDLVGYQ